MRYAIAVVSAFLLMNCSALAQAPSNQAATSERKIEVVPEVVLQLPKGFTALPPTIRGLNEIIVQLPKKQSAHIQVMNEKRRSEDEAIRRLLEVAQEGGAKRTFLEICGWPALERQYRVRLPQVMADLKKPLPEARVVEAATIAIAQGDTLVRFEARLQPGAGAEGTASIFALVRTINCAANPNAPTTKARIEKLKQMLSQNPTWPGF